MQRSSYICSPHGNTYEKIYWQNLRGSIFSAKLWKNTCLDHSNKVFKKLWKARPRLMHILSKIFQRICQYCKTPEQLYREMISIDQWTPNLQQYGHRTIIVSNVSRERTTALFASNSTLPCYANDIPGLRHKQLENLAHSQNFGRLMLRDKFVLIYEYILKLKVNHSSSSYLLLS